MPRRPALLAVVLLAACTTTSTSTSTPPKTAAAYPPSRAYKPTPIASATNGAPIAATRIPLSAGNKGYYRFAATDGRSVVFTAEGDLWRVALAGGAAYRLTTHHGIEKHAAISPNGRLVAFSARYEGSSEVYVMSLGGGKPARLTYDAQHRSAVVGWTRDGRVVYRTTYYSTLPSTRLAIVDPKTRKVELIPLDGASDVAFAKDGALFFTRYRFQGSHTKRYKGGTAQSLWRFDKRAAEAVALTKSYTGTSRDPMVVGDRVFFVSDRDGTMNLWSMDRGGKALKQHTHHKGFDVKDASAGGGKIVYQLGADLHVFDVASGKDAAIAITLVSDFDQQREKWVKKPMRYLSAAHLSPDGRRVVATSRGMVFVMRRKGGRRVQVTRAPGVRFREAHFFEDEKTLLAFSDQSGEVELWKLDARGIQKPVQLTRGARVLRRRLTPSPDGRHVAFTDKNYGLWIADTKTNKTTKIRTGAYDVPSYLRWSHDGRYLAFVDYVANLNRVIYIYDTRGKKILRATNERVDSYSPAWGRGGKWLYFLSDRHLVSVVSSPWGPRQPDPMLAKPTRIYALALRPGYRSPFQPSHELSSKGSEGKGKKGRGKGKSKGKKAGGKGKDKGKKAGKDKTPAKVRIAAKGLVSRLWTVPFEPGRYAGLSATSKHLYFVSVALSRSRHKPGTTLLALPITHKKSKRKVKPVAHKLVHYEISDSGKRLLVRTRGAMYLLAANGRGAKKMGKRRVDTSGWTFSVTPAAEWRQMLRDAWRLERDYFYDRKLHAADWPAILKRHMALLPRVRDRDELADLTAQMVGELQALHTFVGGGDHRRGRTHIRPASLGARWSRVAKGYRIDRIYRADPNYPREQSPLLRPGVDVEVGDVVTHIDGASTLSVPDARALLRGKARRQVRLRLLRKGAAREAIVKPISTWRFFHLRYSDWELSRRLRVDKASNNTIGYVHLRALTGRDYTSWARNFYPVFHKQGLIIDVRNNRGGNIDSWILSKLMRRAWFYWKGRAGKPTWNMQYAFRGHMVVLCNAFTMSDGEAFAEGFRRLKLGKVIGVRTWGGEIWLSYSNRLVDGGIASAAEYGVYGPERRWLIEGKGVVPDIIVDNLPHATFKGQDKQLDAAVAHLKALIKKRPMPVPKPPPFPTMGRRPRK